MRNGNKEVLELRSKIDDLFGFEMQSPSKMIQRNSAKRESKNKI